MAIFDIPGSSLLNGEYVFDFQALGEDPKISLSPEQCLCRALLKSAILDLFSPFGLQLTSEGIKQPETTWQVIRQGRVWKRYQEAYAWMNLILPPPGFDPAIISYEMCCSVLRISPSWLLRRLMEYLPLHFSEHSSEFTMKQNRTVKHVDRYKVRSLRHHIKRAGGAPIYIFPRDRRVWREINKCL